MRTSKSSQHAVERFLDGERVRPATRAKLKEAVGKLERDVVDNPNLPQKTVSEGQLV
jgi:hypothetical protein